MSLTMKQIIMLNHAAWVEHEDLERKMEADRNGAGDECLVNGKTVSADEVANDDALREAQMNESLNFFGRM